MNNFNSIFSLVQQHCNEHGVVTGNQFQKIAAAAGVTVERLHFYLDCLAQAGMIVYSPQNKSISLTEKGAITERVFP